MTGTTITMATQTKMKSVFPIFSVVVATIFTILYLKSTTTTRTNIGLKPGVLIERWKPGVDCTRPPAGFKAWKNGLVTAWKPDIPRNCTKLFNEDKKEIERVANASKKWKNAITDEEFLYKTSDCSWVVSEVSNNLYNTVAEKNFPLAFSFGIHHFPQQVFRIIKLLYRPQNVFCIHYDSKSPDPFKQTFDNIARCLDNVRIATEIIKVQWGRASVMEVQMSCFSDLYQWRKSLPPHQKWKYAMNLCGTELPMVTNRDIVVHLKSLKGSSSIKPGKEIKPNEHGWDRIQPPMPYNMSLYKSSGYNALSYEFLSSLFENPVGIDVHKYFHNCKVPDEHIYVSLFMYPGIPGGYNQTLSAKYLDIVKAHWCYTGKDKKACYGMVAHSICVSSAGDLAHMMKTAKEKGNYFHNKYSYSLDHTAMDCLEERYIRKNQLEYEEECGQLTSRKSVST